jgi:hypothetical protein
VTPAKPLSGKPAVELTELERASIFDGWERVRYRGDDGNTYQSMEKGKVQELWMLIPTDQESESFLDPRRDLL